MNVIEDKIVVKDYFNSIGFDRWRRIYGDGEVNKVQLDIRTGHQQTVDKVIAWLEDDGNLSEISICDAGCGVGSLSIPLAASGATVSASDISEKMISEAKERAQEVLGSDSQVTFNVQDLETLGSKYHSVICLDVLIHYPQDKAAEMISHLCSLAENRIILSFAPNTPALSILKKVGSFFPGASKATRAYLHKEADVVRILADNGFKVQRQDMIRTSFYFSRLLEATR
ncbi:magnesium protoporphyrin IX methyltransferase [Merismopedia glauca]|uniref:Magnesium protoporphyrin IX methyltransferase n=1 Tax=Merismopedia glauca CCAP 1448/3 TaxID=1296344 RepID=A0A2T1C517_9CYAN|nr:magnesium protoporphyrin IX methyltransferase [Merismopedia glauca]PSB03346.1 magnesium protoporphyrin IX methyltransferase [Merismopedia glauca CCAP 1448/3]